MQFTLWYCVCKGVSLFGASKAFYFSLSVICKNYALPVGIGFCVWKESYNRCLSGLKTWPDVQIGTCGCSMLACHSMSCFCDQNYC